jgi:hypothetical protein
MNMWKNLFRTNTNDAPPERVRLTRGNLECWPSFKKLCDDGKVIFDASGRLRYPHGAPVGDLVLIRINKDGTPRYKESAEEWFAPESPRAREFKWPK